MKKIFLISLLMLLGIYGYSQTYSTSLVIISDSNGVFRKSYPKHTEVFDSTSKIKYRLLASVLSTDTLKNANKLVLTIGDTAAVAKSLSGTIAKYDSLELDNDLDTMFAYNPTTQEVKGRLVETVITVTYADILLNNTPSDTSNISAAQGINAARLTQTVIIIQGNGGAVDITADPQIADGAIGDIIELWGNSDVNTVEFDDGTGVQLNGGTSFTMGVGDNLILRYMTVGGVTEWFEISRSDN